MYGMRGVRSPIPGSATVFFLIINHNDDRILHPPEIVMLYYATNYDPLLRTAVVFRNVNNVKFLLLINFIFVTASQTVVRIALYIWSCIKRVQTDKKPSDEPV